MVYYGRYLRDLCVYHLKGKGGHHDDTNHLFVAQQPPLRLIQPIIQSPLKEIGQTNHDDGLQKAQGQIVPPPHADRQIADGKQKHDHSPYRTQRQCGESDPPLLPQFLYD